MILLNTTQDVQAQIDRASFSVSELPIMAQGIIATDRKMIVGDHNDGHGHFYISTVGKNYFVLPYGDILAETANMFQGMGEFACVQTLNEHKRLIAMIDLGEVTIAGQKEKIVLLVKSSLDGTWKLEFEVAIYRVICGNGMIIPLFDFGAASVKHTKFAGMKIDDAHRVAQNAIGAANHYKQQREKLDRVKVAAGDILPLVLGLMNGRSTKAYNTAVTVADLAMHGAGNDGSTLDSVLNGITEHFSHEGAHREAGQRRFESSFTGTAAKHKAQFFTKLVGVLEKDEVSAIVRAGESIRKEFA